MSKRRGMGSRPFFRPTLPPFPFWLFPFLGAPPIVPPSPALFSLLRPPHRDLHCRPSTIFSSSSLSLFLPRFSFYFLSHHSHSLRLNNHLCTGIPSLLPGPITITFFRLASQPFSSQQTTAPHNLLSTISDQDDAPSAYTNFYLSPTIKLFFIPYTFSAQLRYSIWTSYRHLTTIHSACDTPESRNAPR